MTTERNNVSLLARPLANSVHPTCGVRLGDRRVPAGQLLRINTCSIAGRTATLRVEDPASPHCGTFTIVRLLDCPLGRFAVLAGAEEAYVVRLENCDVAGTLSADELPPVLRWLEADAELAGWDAREAEWVFGALARHNRCIVHA